MKKNLFIIAFALSATLLLGGCTSGSDGSSKAGTDVAQKTPYQYYTASQTKDAVEDKKDIILLDIQVTKEWNAHHIKGAIPTYAYPVKTDQEKAKLDSIIPKLKGDQPIVVICPGGAGGAQRTIDYLSGSKGIKAERLFILKDGQSKWPYGELLEK